MLITDAYSHRAVAKNIIFIFRGAQLVQKIQNPNLEILDSNKQNFFFTMHL